MGALREAGFGPGDVLKVEADGPGRLALTRVDEMLGRYSGRLATRGRFGKAVEGLREEWR